MTLSSFAGVPVEIVEDGFRPFPHLPDLVVQGTSIVYADGRIWATQEGARNLWAAEQLENPKGRA